MFTFFSTCKPARHGIFHTIQRNAIGSWKQLTDDVILLGDEKNGERHIEWLGRETGCRCIGGLERNRWGTPLMGSLFKKAQNHAKHDVLCYVNSDIVLLSDFTLAVERMKDAFSDWLMVARKWNLNHELSPINFQEDWEVSLRKWALKNGWRHYPTSSDFFCFTRGLFDFLDWLPLAVGRWRTDTWLVGMIYYGSLPIVDATRVVLPLHQKHPLARRDTPEEIYNQHLSKGYGHRRIGLLKLEMTRKGITKK